MRGGTWYLSQRSSCVGIPVATLVTSGSLGRRPRRHSSGLGPPLWRANDALPARPGRIVDLAGSVGRYFNVMPRPLCGASDG